MFCSWSQEDCQAVWAMQFFQEGSREGRCQYAVLGNFRGVSVEFFFQGVEGPFFRLLGGWPCLSCHFRGQTPTLPPPPVQITLQCPVWRHLPEKSILCFCFIFVCLFCLLFFFFFFSLLLDRKDSKKEKYNNTHM